MCTSISYLPCRTGDHGRLRAARYPDLRKAFGNNSRLALEHFLTYGWDEVRRHAPTGPAIITPSLRQGRIGYMEGGWPSRTTVSNAGLLADQSQRVYVSTSPRMAGGVDSVVWHSHEFINAWCVSVRVALWLTRAVAGTMAASCRWPSPTALASASTPPSAARRTTGAVRPLAQLRAAASFSHDTRTPMCRRRHDLRDAGAVGGAERAAEQRTAGLLAGAGRARAEPVPAVPRWCVRGHAAALTPQRPALSACLTQRSPTADRHQHGQSLQLHHHQASHRGCDRQRLAAGQRHRVPHQDYAGLCLRSAADRRCGDAVRARSRRKPGSGPTGYMNGDFDRFFIFNATTGALQPVSTDDGEVPQPLVFLSQQGKPATASFMHCCRTAKHEGACVLRRRRVRHGRHRRAPGPRLDTVERQVLLHGGAVHRHHRQVVARVPHQQPRRGTPSPRAHRRCRDDRARRARSSR